MNKLIKYSFVVLLAFCIRKDTSAQPGIPFRSNSSPSFSPSRPQNFRKLDAIKNAYINKRLNLTPDEADRFWPLYNQYQGELSQLLRERRQNNASTQTGGVEKVNKDLYFEQQLLSVRKRYMTEFLKVLPSEKVDLLYQSEREFKDELIHQLHERKNN
ncbi:hypothetical protein MUY27_10685 [Mucilaginibacter sp. RS28]|uniref:Sensor of ECF-type sigma factor n=1 Tax=Mucilaginibacter straminoryzae TaxID=2932774 RepID=A0A9X1X2Q8_9SPHI|nr:hypothetical protein [Mucilaginibacter straminoryzae]MCJ8210177.1 hypothetical protein [Mucilaginibacter straminoryzae]